MRFAAFFLLLSSDSFDLNRAFRWTSGKVDFSSSPIYIRVMVIEPGMSNNGRFVSKVTHSKGSFFCMIFEHHGQLNFLLDRASFVECSINIVNRNGSRKFDSIKVMILHKSFVKKRPVAPESSKAVTGILTSVSKVFKIAGI